jgi:hypothetical protein
MKYFCGSLVLLERDILSSRISFETGMEHVPREEKDRFLWRLNRLISEERMKFPGAESLARLKDLDELVSAAINAARLGRAGCACAS